ncbi:hypothetical protein F8M41_008524 [Gigaspora margarita]|uniref:Uncharacterized protein n=1 Tax=Gigaspora margarita TaxID=4874 RepID=A0A8H4B4E9_GIGMA|nr:hypothetical protein F8M41_008524 [Gigaspora margarita]
MDNVKHEERKDNFSIVNIFRIDQNSNDKSTIILEGRNDNGLDDISVFKDKTGLQNENIINRDLETSTYRLNTVVNNGLNNEDSRNSLNSDLVKMSSNLNNSKLNNKPINHLNNEHLKIDLNDNMNSILNDDMSDDLEYNMNDYMSNNLNNEVNDDISSNLNDDISSNLNNDMSSNLNDDINSGLNNNKNSDLNYEDIDDV